MKFTNLIFPAKWFCPNCWHPTREPSKLTGRAWCRLCETYLFPTQKEEFLDDPPIC